MTPYNYFSFKTVEKREKESIVLYGMKFALPSGSGAYEIGGVYVRIEEHPILTFKRGKKIKFYFDGKEYEGFEGDTIASALHAAGVKVLGHSHNHNRPRGFYCAIGNCSSCLMTVDGEPNVRVCIEKLREGMMVETQKGKGVLK